MSYLLEILGRGLVSSLRGALDSKLPEVTQFSLRSLRERADVDPGNLQALAMLGLKLLELGDLPNARASFERVLDREEEDVPALLGLACVQDELGHVAESLELLNRCRVIDILDPVILFCIGFCNEKLGHHQDAIDAYRASLRVCPELRNSHERLAAIFLDNGKYHFALSHYQELVELEPERISDRLTLANLYLVVEDYENAIRQYQTAIALDPDNWEVQDDLVAAYIKAGLIREAIEHLESLAEQQPDFADHHLRLGELYSMAGDDESAQVHLENALRLQPEYLEALVKLGTIHLRSGCPDEAAECFTRAVEVNDTLLSACIGLGISQLQAGHTEDGRGSLELAARIEPNSSLLFSETARMQLSASIGEQLHKYLGADPEELTPEHGRTLASSLIDKQIERHQQAVKEKPRHADLHYRLGLLLKNRNRIEEAIEAFRRAVEINPVYEKALVKLGLTLRSVGAHDEAVEVLTRALSISADQVRLHYQLGLIFAEKHLFELAVDHFEKAGTGVPHHADLEAELSLALQNAGLLDRAEVSRRITEELQTDPAPIDANLN